MSPPFSLRRTAVAAALLAISPLACSETRITQASRTTVPTPPEPQTPPPGAGIASADAPPADAAPVDAAPLDAADADAPDPALTDPMANHRETREDILALFSLRSFTDEERKAKRPEQYLAIAFGPGGPARINQGNKALAKHLISKQQCLDGLKGVVLQTEEQKAACGGAENMVPIYAGGDRSAAKFCIDIFEFPNKPCELPMVWVAPSTAATVCSYQGKRLCAQEEWNLACRADPEGGPDSTYAYGNELDLAVCNTQKHQERVNGLRRCAVRDAQMAWNTCATETEPSGAYPKCRSRFGVYDQHGNIAEIMTRKDPDKGLVSQLKGSAWFYIDVYRNHEGPLPPGANAHDTYPDHCNYDPRWHVEPMSSALHVNYHLGMRCCKSI